MRIRALLSAIFNPIRACHHVWSIIQLGGDEKFERAEKLCTTLRTYKVHLRQIFRRTSPLWSIRNQTGRGQFDRCELVNFLNARGRRLRDGRYSSRPLNAAEFRPISISSLVDDWNASSERRRRRRNDEMIVEETINRIVVADNVDRQNEFRHRSSFKYLASRSLTRLNEIAIASAIIPITWLVRRAMRQPRTPATPVRCSWPIMRYLLLPPKHRDKGNLLSKPRIVFPRRDDSLVSTRAPLSPDFYLSS